jgi:hypothetical protein
VADTIALFCGCGALGGSLPVKIPSARSDAALIYCCIMGVDARDISVLLSELTDASRRSIAAALSAWSAKGAHHLPSPVTEADAMAYLESFKRSVSAPILRADSFVTLARTPLNALMRNKRRQATRSAIKEFCGAGADLWCPEGDTTLLALMLQALDGPLPTGGRVWSKAEERRSVAVLLALRAQAAKTDSVDACPRQVSNRLADRSLILIPAHPDGAFEEILPRSPETATTRPALTSFSTRCLASPPSRKSYRCGPPRSGRRSTPSSSSSSRMATPAAATP